jgi:DNA polymerase-3 subunit alpha
MESLIKAGAMDRFGKRAQLLIDFPDIVDSSTKKKKEGKLGQASLFGDEVDLQAAPKSSTKDFEDFTSDEKLAFEKEFLGLYLTAHPQLDNLMKFKNDITHEIEFLDEEKEQTVVTVGGIIEAIRRIFTKKTGKEMAFVTIANENGITLECVVFPKIFDIYKSLLVKDNVILVYGKIDTKNEKPVIIVDKIRGIRDFSS